MTRDLVPDDALENRLAQADSEADRAAMLPRQIGEGSIGPVPDGFRLSVVIPVYNEQRWVGELVRRVRAVPIPKEILIVDDGSTDGTRDVLREWEGRDGITV